MILIFPRRTIAWKVEEPAALRQLTLSAAEIGLLTGVALRLAHSLVMTRSAASSLTWVVWWYILFALILFGAAAAHLGNYPVRHWGWRAPLFALYESAGEVVTSLVLIAAHRELWGSARAGFADWPSIAISILLWRMLTICSFTLILAGVVQLVRSILNRHDRQTEAAHPSASA